MSQVLPQTCPKCHAPVNPGQAFCPNCGTNLTNSSGIFPPTVAAQSGSGGTFPPTIAAQPEGAGVFPPTMAAAPNVGPNTGGGYNASTPPPPIGLPNSAYGTPPGYSSPSYDPYSSGAATPPPPPTDPYSGGAPANSYAPPPPQPGQYAPPIGAPGPYTLPNKKKSPALYIVLGVVLAVLVVCGGSAWAVTKALSGKDTGSGGTSSSGNSGGGQFAAEQKVDLSVVYSSVQFNFTSLQQANKFSDDSLSGLSYNGNKNYVRVNFKEQQTSQKSSYFSYSSSFLLILPDKTTASSLKAQEYSGPEGGVVRTNWVDFELSKQVDLSKLSLRLGASDEAQMTFPLKTGADVSKYKPQQATLNKSFQYAGMDWTLKDATQIYYNNGKQAKSGKVFVLVDLKANNPDGNGSVYLYSGFVRLKSGDTVSAPTYDSNLDDFDIIDSGTTNVQGTAVFETPPSGTYTLTFTSGKNIAATSVDFSVGSGS